MSSQAQTSPSTWATMTAGGQRTAPRAHRVEPAGGDGFWRAGCGLIVRREPVPVGPEVPRCSKCVAQHEGSQLRRPIIYGQRLHETRLS